MLFVLKSTNQCWIPLWGSNTSNGQPLIVILSNMLRMSVSRQYLQSFFTLFIAENPCSTVAVASGRVSINFSTSIKVLGNWSLKAVNILCHKMRGSKCLKLFAVTQAFRALHSPATAAKSKSFLSKAGLKCWTKQSTSASPPVARIGLLQILAKPRDKKSSQLQELDLNPGFQIWNSRPGWLCC